MFISLLKRLQGTVKAARGERRARRHSPPTAWLGVSELEDRVTPTTLHWLGGAGGNLWSVAANWLENQAPASGDRLVFDTTTPGFSATSGFSPSNDLSGLTGLAVAINDSSSAGDFTITGNAFGLLTSTGTGITSTVTTGTAAAINNNISLGADTTVAVGFGSLTLGGVVSGAHLLTAAGAPSSTVLLNAANTYSGGTVVTSGTVSVNTNTSLGTGTLTLNGGTLANAAAFLSLSNPFVVAAPSTIGGGSFFTLTGDGTLNALLTLSNSGFLTLNGALSGPGGLQEIGFPGSTTLGGSTPNTFTGGTTVVFGGVTLAKTAGVNALVSPVTLTGGFTSLTLNASNQLNNNVSIYLGKGATFSTNGFSDTVQALTGLGALSTGSSATAGLTVTGGGTQLLTGAVSGAGLLTYSGSGSLTLAGASVSYTGTLTAASGTLVVAADFSGATAKVTGGALGGTGVVKSVAATRGFVDPAATGGGVLHTAAVAAASSLNGATFRADLGAQGASDSLALGAGATLDLTGATLALNAVGSTFATTYQLITSSSGGLSGTFASLPENSTINVSGHSFRINYTPAAVTLTNLGTGARTLHWTGATGSNWSTAANWAENVVPASGDTLVFDTNAPGFAATLAAFAPNNDLSGLTNIAIVINDGSWANDFGIGGNALGLVTTAGTGIASTVYAGKDAKLNTPLTLAANTTVDVGLGSLTLGGVIGGAFSLTANGSQVGTLTLNAANTYSGGTVVTSGTVSVNTNTSLGTGTLTLNGGTLANAAAFLHVANPFVVNAPSTIGGGSFFDLDGNGVLNADLRLTNSGFLTLAGAISGTGGLIEDGFPGSTTLAGTAANTYTGPTTIIGGGLTLAKSAGVNAVVSPIAVNGSLNWSAANQLNGNVPVTIGVGGSVNTNGYSDTLASLSGIGSVNNSTTTGTGLTVLGSGAAVLTGSVTGGGIFNYNGTGSLTLGGNSSSFSGQLVAQQGSLLVAADFSGATASAQGAGTLGGTGIVKTVATGGGTITPGGSAGGILTAAGGSFNSILAGDTFRIDITDTGLSDQLVIGSGATINLTNATLTVNAIHSTLGSAYTIVASPTGGISGTFTGLPDGASITAGGRQFTIRYSPTAVTLTERPAPTLTPSVPAGEVGIGYNQTITATGGTGAVTLAVSNVTGANGLTISGTGTGAITISGSPTVAGTVSFTVTPTDDNGASVGKVYSITINPAVVLGPTTLPGGEVGQPYGQAITPTGGSGSVTLALSGVSNTTGLTISGDDTGSITVSGTPTSAGTVTFTVTPTDAIGTGTGTVYSFDVSPAVTLAPTTLPTGEVGQSYSQTVTPTGGSGPVTLAVSSVTNTTGLTISGDGTGSITVSGTPTAAGTVSFTVTPADAVGTGTGTVYSFTIYPAVALAPATLTGAAVGVAYSQTITPTGGSGSVTLALSGVTNTSGLTISGDGTGSITVSGTPTAAGTVSFTVTPTDALGTGAGKVYSFDVNTVDLTISLQSSLNPAPLNTSVTFSLTLTPVSGTAPRPTGDVQFFDNGVALGAPVALAAVAGNTALATITAGAGAVPLLAGGPHTITAQYNPASSTNSAAQAGLTQAVTVGSTTTVQALNSPSVFGQSVAFLVSVAQAGGAGVPTGTVTLYDAATGATLGTGTLNGSGQTAISTSALPVGTRAIRADYSGDPTYLASSGTTTQVVTHQTRIAVGSDAGPIATVQVFDPLTGARLAVLTPFDGYTLGVKVATGDVNGDGISDIIVSAGAGAPGGHVKVYNGANYSQLASFFTFLGFTGGVNVGAGDVDGDGCADVIVGTAIANDHVKAFSGRGLTSGATPDASTLMSFFAYGGGNPVGVTVAAGDVDGDGRADIITGSATFAGHVKAFQGGTGALIGSYFAYGAGYLGGIYVASGDVDGDGRAEIITGASNAPHVKVLTQAGEELASFFAYPGSPFGVRVGAVDVDGDRLVDILTGAGGSAPHVKVFKGNAPQTVLRSFIAQVTGLPTSTSGIFVGGG